MWYANSARFGFTDLRIYYLQAVLKCSESSCKTSNCHPKGHLQCSRHVTDCCDRDSRKLTPWCCYRCANLLMLAATDSDVGDYHRKVAACFLIAHWGNVTRTWDRAAIPDSFKRFPFLKELLVKGVVCYSSQEMSCFFI